MKKWTIIIKVVGSAGHSELEVMNPETYVSFPTQRLAEDYSDMLTDNYSALLNFVTENWGEQILDPQYSYVAEAAERDWWQADDETSVLEDKWAGRIRMDFITAANKILKDAVSELISLNIGEHGGYRASIGNLSHRLIGDHSDSVFKKMIRELEKQNYWKYAAAYQLNQKLELLKMD